MIDLYLHHSDDDTAEKKLKELLFKRRVVTLTLTKSCFDILNAIHFLPPGEILWSGKLTPRQSAIAGFIASLVGLQISLITRWYLTCQYVYNLQVFSLLTFSLELWAMIYWADFQRLHSTQDILGGGASLPTVMLRLKCSYFLLILKVCCSRL